MQEKQILIALEELKDTTREISKMLQILLYNLFDVEKEIDDDEQPNLLVGHKEEEDYNRKYGRAYLG